MGIEPEQHFTEPPPRYSEASLVKALEEHGIGRPSTYASIISTLRDREYVEMDGKRFIPTDIGKIVNRFLTQEFPPLRGIRLHGQAWKILLDAISRGEEEWVPLMHQFWKPFIDAGRAHREERLARAGGAGARAGQRPRRAASPVSVRMGRYGPFVQIGTKDDVEKPQLRRPAARPEDGHDQLDAGAGAVQAAAQARRRRPTASPSPASIGRFGPYIKYGSKYVSLKGRRSVHRSSCRARWS